MINSACADYLPGGFDAHCAPDAACTSPSTPKINGRPSPPRPPGCEQRAISFVSPVVELSADDAHVVTFVRECVRRLHHAWCCGEVAAGENTDAAFHC